ncbi:MAG: hypothetical protein CMA66_01030 [Euryarchaeota archaeon]|jgi:hypothetical protein|nr:hypothetical protein [Euryarchaeota archaeon]|tara:strand:+ start:70 stop:258 length:189 start_codon:yes stop_codon:yes gene_type:complete
MNIKDYAELSMTEFKAVLDAVTSREELQGLANRRSYLKADLKKYNSWQISMIKRRKQELENG